MTEWTVVTVIIALVGLIGTVAVPGRAADEKHKGHD